MYNPPISIRLTTGEEYMDEYFRTLVSAQDNYIVARVRSTLGVDIDRDELIKALNYDRQQYEKGYEDGKRDAVEHGRWENIRFLTTGDGRIRVGDCSSCKSIERVTRYCPNCGAKMDEKGEAE